MTTAPPVRRTAQPHIGGRGVRKDHNSARKSRESGTDRDEALARQLQARYDREAQELVRHSQRSLAGALADNNSGSRLNLQSNRAPSSRRLQRSSQQSKQSNQRLPESIPPGQKLPSSRRPPERAPSNSHLKSQNKMSNSHNHHHHSGTQQFSRMAHANASAEHLNRPSRGSEHSPAFPGRVERRSAPGAENVPIAYAVPVVSAVPMACASATASHYDNFPNEERRLRKTESQVDRTRSDANRETRASRMPFSTSDAHMRPVTPGSEAPTVDALAPLPKRHLTKEQSEMLDAEYARRVQQELVNEDIARRILREERVVSAPVHGVILPSPSSDSTGARRPTNSSRNLRGGGREPVQQHSRALPSYHVKTENICARAISKTFSLAICVTVCIICGVVVYVVFTGNNVDIPGTDITVQDITDVIMHDPWQYGPNSEQTQTYWMTSGNQGLSLRVYNALTEDWYTYFYAAVNDWDNGDPDALTIATQQIQADPDCEAITGTMKVCNNDYGETGWKGINEVLITAAGVITVSTAKMNEFYLSNAGTADRRYTMCHEMGHGFGLNHVDENFNNRDQYTCMDYTNNPEDNMSPNASNYQLLASLYGLVGGGTYSPTTSSTTDTTSTTSQQQRQDVYQDGIHRNLRSLNHPQIQFDSNSDYHTLNHARLLKPSFSNFKNQDERVLSSEWKLLHRRRGREVHVRELEHGFKVLAHVLLAQEYHE